MSRYEEVARIDDHDGASARITRRENANGLVQFSFQFFRTFEKGGETKETVWFSPRHIPALVRLTGEVDERIKLFKEQLGRSSSAPGGF